MAGIRTFIYSEAGAPWPFRGWIVMNSVDLAAVLLLLVVTATLTWVGFRSLKKMIRKCNKESRMMKLYEEGSQKPPDPRELAAQTPKAHHGIYDLYEQWKASRLPPKDPSAVHGDHITRRSSSTNKTQIRLPPGYSTSPNHLQFGENGHAFVFGNW